MNKKSLNKYDLLPCQACRWIHVFVAAEWSKQHNKLIIIRKEKSEYSCKCTKYCFGLQEDFPTGRKYTFKQLKDFSIKVASALHKKGYKKGDILATFTINLPEFTILVMAASAIGVIISPANPAYTACNISFLARITRQFLFV